MTKVLVVPDARPSLNVNITADKGEWGKYRYGDPIRFSMESNESAQVAVIGIDIHGDLTLLLPNNYDQNNKISAYNTYFLPRQGYSYKIDTQKSGTEHVLMLGTRRHSSLMNDLINKIRTGVLSNYNQLGSFLRQVVPQTNGDWNSDTISYYCNYAPQPPSYSNTVILSIGISDYMSINGLSSPAKDARAFAGMMKDKYGISSSDIITLTNSSATKRGILSAFDRILGKVGSRTNLIIFYSGHGGQIPDNNGDEGDGKDEVICPYDFSKSNQRATGIVDDEIANYLKKFSAKANDVVMIFDSCFSGSAHKAVRMKSDGWNQPKMKTISPGGLGSENGAKAVDSKGLSNFVFLSSSKGSEPSIDAGEDLGYSLYTYYLLKGMNGAADINSDGEITTIEIHNFIKNGIKKLSSQTGNYYQTPLIDPNTAIIIAR